jgi:hypothetical protein
VIFLGRHTWARVHPSRPCAMDAPPLSADAKTAAKSIQALACRVPPAVWVALAVVLTVGVVAGLARASAPAATRLTGKAAVAAKELVTSAATLSTQAAQDVEPRQRLKDVTTGLAYVAAARFLAPDDVLQAKTGVKVGELWATLRAQDAAATGSGPLALA